MILRIEKSSGVPITRQILDQIRTQCATEALMPGDKLPSVRHLARELTVNQNTVLRVYERLEAEGLIERRHGAGTFVRDNGAADPMKAQLDQLRREAEGLVHHAKTLGLAKSHLRKIIDEAYASDATSSDRKKDRNE